MVLAPVEGGGPSRVLHVEGTTQGEFQKIIGTNLFPEAHICTGETPERFKEQVRKVGAAKPGPASESAKPARRP